MKILLIFIILSPGKVMDTPDGPKFILGLTIDTKYSGSVFIPGQVIQTDNGMKVEHHYFGLRNTSVRNY